MVHLIDGRDIPGGQNQIAYAKEVVTQRFAEANIPFRRRPAGQGRHPRHHRLIGGIAAFLPIPGLSGLVSFIKHGDPPVADLCRRESSSATTSASIRPRRSRRRGKASCSTPRTADHGQERRLAGGHHVGVSFVIFLLMLAPAGAILFLMPGQLAGWAFVLAIVFAWAFKAAFIEPFAIACLMQVYFKTNRGPGARSRWDARLAEASSKFRELRDKALASFGGSRWGTAGAAH